MMARCRWREDGGKEEEQDESPEHDDSEEHRWHARVPEWHSVPDFLSLSDSE